MVVDPNTTPRRFTCKATSRLCFVVATLVVVLSFEASRQMRHDETALASEFEGFINYGTPIQTSGVDSSGLPINVIVTPSAIEEPVFRSSTRWFTRAVDAAAKIARHPFRSLAER
ncbi:hypothetical protein [Verrucomicrobium sp. BvORR106]|uniref:hypothetical protein n=1 Tax=Verrucomicrobium sp. BvORR106 TaxID=1403819 RepID=UPI002240F4B4|nr:hypothetical protein [Verrucomicrobium sp. BvORR106]